MRKTTRREFMAYTAALASTTAACSGERTMAVSDDLTRLSATDAIGAMRRGDLAAEDYASALLERCRQGDYLNAFRTLDAERVMEAARAADQQRNSGTRTGLLHGLPIPVKDSVNTRDYPTSGGTRALENFYPAEDAELVRRLTTAGGIVMGKTNVHELSFGWTSNNYAFGPVRNPYNRERIPGGSSGGTAAAIAAGMAPLGIAEDTQGSIRVPAAFCGIYGFRPTQNRYPNQGVVPITPLFDQVGPHARDMADIALFDEVITGEPRISDPVPLDGLRLGIAREHYFSSLDSEVEAATNDALSRLSDAGVVLVEAEVPNLGELISLTTAQVQLYHVKPMLERYLEEFDTGLTFDDVMAAASDDIRATFEEFVLGGAGTPSEADFIAARDEHLPALRQAMRAYFEENGLDAMIFPAAQITATPIGQDLEVSLNGRTVPFEPVVSRNISPGSTAGLPGLTVPIAQDGDGLPISLEIDGPAGGDRAVLGIGLALESLFGHLPNPSV